MQGTKAGKNYCVFLMQGTKGLFDKEMIGRMKKGSYLVNTARGAICDTQAVKEALESGHLRGCEHPAAFHLVGVWPVLVDNALQVCNLDAALLCCSLHTISSALRQYARTYRSEMVPGHSTSAGSCWEHCLALTEQK